MKKNKKKRKSTLKKKQHTKFEEKRTYMNEYAKNILKLENLVLNANYAFLKEKCGMKLTEAISI